MLHRKPEDITSEKILMITPLWELRDGALRSYINEISNILKLRILELRAKDMKLYALLFTGLIAQDYDYDFYGDKDQDNSFQSRFSQGGK